MVTKRFRLVFFIIFGVLPLLATGCWDAKDVNETSIATAIILDKKDDEIHLYVEIANIEAAGGENQTTKANQYIFVKGIGKTIPEARDNLELQLDKRLYISSTRTLVLTEDFAKEYLLEYLYRLRAEEEYRKRVLTVITMEEPEDLLNISNEKQISVGFAIDELVENLQERGATFSSKTVELIENLSSRHSGNLIHCIGLQEENISLTGYFVMNGIRVDGFIPIEESNGVLILKADKPRFIYRMPYEENNLTINITLKKQKIKPSYEQDQIRFDLKFSFEAELMYGDKMIPYNFDEKQTEEITEMLTERLKKEITDTLEKAQKVFTRDYFAFDDKFRIKFPALYHEMEWESEFPNAKMQVDVAVEFDSTWMMDYDFEVIR